jgi:hypothetical protein
MRYELHFASKELEFEDIPCIEFDNYDQLIGFIFSDTDEHGTVWLISIHEEVYVSEYITSVIDFINTWSNRFKNHQCDIMTIFLQEYNSFESAYQVALDMKEDSPLCYDLE